MHIERMKEVLEDFSSKKVLVIGDFYLDEYFHCSAKNFSPEAPVPRAIIKHIEHVPGCAGNVAIALRSLGAQVLCTGVIGNDEKGRILQNKLLAQNVMTNGLYPDMSRLTGVFSRILLESSSDINQHSIRFDQENTGKISLPAKQKVLEFIKRHTSEIDLIFVADYDEAQGTGLVSLDFLANVIDIAKAHAIPTLGISRLNIGKFTGVDILVCNRKEASEESGIEITDKITLAQAAETMLVKTKAQTLIITEGKDGFTLARKGEVPMSVPSHATEVVDVCGAGDALSSAFALTTLTSATDPEKMLVASHAAAVAVSKLGTAPVYSAHVLEHFSNQSVQQTKLIRDHIALREKISTLQQKGKRVVFTNGYFDGIHLGHIKFLKEASKCGDVFVVALNNDRSTWENKGEGFPKIPEDDRVEIVSSMQYVDFVTVFEELTPLKIISTLKPDVLVKGREHQQNEIVGKDIVEANGGEVRILDAQKF